MFSVDMEPIACRWSLVAASLTKKNLSGVFTKPYGGQNDQNPFVLFTPFWVFFLSSFSACLSDVLGLVVVKPGCILLLRVPIMTRTVSPGLRQLIMTLLAGRFWISSYVGQYCRWPF